MQLTDLIIPVVFAGVIIFGFVRKVDVFSVFCDGAAEGLRTTADILPALILLLVSVGMLRASGAVTMLTELLSPLCGLVGFPPECMQMVLLRPFSGSGALAVYDGIASQCGADSFPERVAAVLLGSSETTFYTVAVYFSAVKVRRTGYAVPAALTADLTAWLVCGVTVGLILGY
mgnify:FL=1